MRKKLLSNVMLLLAMLFVGVGSAWAQTDKSEDYTGNVALSSTGGSNASACKVKISETEYDGIKAGTSSKDGAVVITVPQGTKYLHLHIAGWNGATVKVEVTNPGYFSDGLDSGKISLTSDSGISGNSPFTFSGDASSSDYYKVLTFESALAEDKEFKFTATSGRRFVVWGVTAETESTTPGDQSVSTTVTIDDSGITNTNVFEGTAAGSLSATVTAGDESVQGATVTWSGDNDEVATIDASTGVVTLVAAGTVKFTASYAGVDGTYKPSSKTYTMTVTNQDPNAPGTENNPYSVAEAIDAIDNNGNVTGVYVEGYISQIDSYSNSKYITYWISEDGTKTATQFEVYKGLGLNGADFSSKDDLAEGAKVVIKGNITYYSNGDVYEFSTGSQLVVLELPQIQQQDPTITVADATIAFGETFTVDETAITGGAITVTSGNSEIATVSGLVITPKAVGTVVITVATGENTYYYAGQETFTLTITAPAGLTVAPAGSVTLFNETFDQIEGTGGNDGTFTGSVGTSSTTGLLDETWEGLGNNGASKCVKLGTGSSAASITTSEIALTGNGTLTFSAAGWGDTKTNTLTVTAEGATLSGDTEITLDNGTWTDYSVNITEATGAVKLTFEMKRGFLDEIKVGKEGGAYTESVSLNASGYATYASKYPLDFTNASDYSAWAITAVEGSTITFSQISGAVKGGEGILLKGEASASVEIASADCDDAFAGNLLEGTLAPTYVAADKYFGLSGDSFVKVNAGTVKAGKAILPAAAISSNVKALTFVFNGTDGIQTVETVSVEDAAQIFDLAGRRLAQPRKGVNIVNGKKVLVK